MYSQLNIGPSLLEQQLILNPLIMKTPIPAFRCASDTGPALNDYNNSTMGPAPNGGLYSALVQDSNGATHQIALSNYVAVANPGDSTTPPVDPTIYGPALGVAFQNSKISIRDITDGTSNQLLVGERAYKFKGLVTTGSTERSMAHIAVTVVSAAIILVAVISRLQTDQFVSSVKTSTPARGLCPLLRIRPTSSPIRSADLLRATMAMSSGNSRFNDR